MWWFFVFFFKHRTSLCRKKTLKVVLRPAGWFGCSWLPCTSQTVEYQVGTFLQPPVGVTAKGPDGMGCKYLNRSGAFAGLSPFLRDRDLGAQLSLSARAAELMWPRPVAAATAMRSRAGYFPCSVKSGSAAGCQAVQFWLPPCFCLYEVFAFRLGLCGVNEMSPLCPGAGTSLGCL